MIWHQVKIKAFHAYNKERNLLHFVKIIMPLSYVIRVFLSVCEWTSGEFINLFVKNYHAIAWFYERYKIKHSRQITFQNNFCESNLDSIFTNLFLRVLKTNVIDKIIIFVPCENISLWKKKQIWNHYQSKYYMYKWNKNFTRAIILNKTNISSNTGSNLLQSIKSDSI